MHWASYDGRSGSGAVYAVVMGSVLSLAFVTQGSGCASGEELGQPQSTSSSTTSQVTSSTSGGGTMSSSTSTGGGGSGGNGGSSTMSSASSGGGGNGGSGGGGGGGGGCPTNDTVLIFAGGGPGMWGFEFHPASGWSTTTFGEQTMHGVSVALLDGCRGVGLYRSNSAANAGKLMYVPWTDGVWSNPTAIGATVTTREKPTIVASGGHGHAVFHGDNFFHYYDYYDPSMVPPWPQPVQAIGPLMMESFGPTYPTVTMFGGFPLACFAGSNSNLYTQPYDSMSGWLPGFAHFGAMPPSVSVSPTLVTLSQGNEMLIVFVNNQSNNELWWTKGSGISWTAPSLIHASALSNEQVALTALPMGEAVMAYRGQDGMVYTARYTPGAMAPWSIPVPLANPNVATLSAPSLAPGVGAALAELTYVTNPAGVVMHSRLLNMSFSAPAPVGGNGLTYAAISSTP